MSNGKPPAQVVFNIDPDMDIDGELEFQDFSKAAPNASSTSPQAPAYSNLPLNGQLSPQSNQSANSPQQQQQQQQPGSGGKFWHLEYYSQYFNVDTAMVSQRLAVALIPVKKYLDVANGNPDLYGPIWITATVVFAIFFGDTIATSAQRGKASYDFGKLTAAASVFYSIVGLIPLIIWGVSRYFHIKARFIELVALFGYGLTVWIPVSIFAAIPWTSVRWIVCLVGLGVSVMFSVRNFTPLFSSAERDPNHPGEQPLIVSKSVQLSTGAVMVLVVLAIQLGIACSFLFYFLVPKPQ